MFSSILTIWKTWRHHFFESELCRLFWILAVSNAFQHTIASHEGEGLIRVRSSVRRSSSLVFICLFFRSSSTRRADPSCACFWSSACSADYLIVASQVEQERPHCASMKTTVSSLLKLNILKAGASKLAESTSLRQRNWPDSLFITRKP